MTKTVQKSKARDMTQGSIWKQLLLFSLPLMAGNLFQQLYNKASTVVFAFTHLLPDNFFKQFFYVFYINKALHQKWIFPITTFLLKRTNEKGDFITKEQTILFFFVSG